MVLVKLLLDITYNLQYDESLYSIGGKLNSITRTNMSRDSQQRTFLYSCSAGYICIF